MGPHGPLCVRRPVTLVGGHLIRAPAQQVAPGVQMGVGLMCRGPYPKWSCHLREETSLGRVNGYPMIAIAFPAGNPGDESVPRIL